MGVSVYVWSVLVAAGLLVGGGSASQTPAGGPAAAPPPSPTPPAAQSPAAVERATQVLAATRQALGGEKLAGIKTLVVTGRTRRIRGNNLVPIEFEISLERPGKYVRRDESPFEESDPTTTGFNGDTLIQLPVPTVPARPAAAGRPAPALPTPEQLAAQQRGRVTMIKQELSRMTLGLFADALESYPLTFAHIAVAEAPQGKADVLEARGEGNFTLRFFINSQTRQPIMVSWTQPPTSVIVTVPGQPAPATVPPGAVVVAGPAAPAASATAAEKEAYAKEVLALRQRTQAAPVEHRLYYADYRDVDGVLLPFRFRRAIGADTTEETTVDRYRVNVKIAPERFTPVK